MRMYKLAKFIAKKINKDICLIAAGQLINIIFNFALLKLLTNQLSVNDFGYYSIWLTVMLFLRQVIYDPFSVVVAKEAASDSKTSSSHDFFLILNHATEKALKVLILVSLGLMVIDFILLKKTNYVYILPGLIYLVSNGAQGIYVNLLNSLKKRKHTAIIISADAILKFFIISILLKVFNNSHELTLFGVALSSLFLYACTRIKYTSILTSTRLVTSECTLKSKYMMQLSLPLVMPMALVALKSVIDRWLMVSIVGVEELSAYSVLLQLGFMPMVLIIGVIQTYLSPNIYEITKKNKCEAPSEIISYIHKIIIAILAFSLMPTILALAYSSQAVEFFTDYKYINYAGMLPFFVVSGVIFALSGIVNVAVFGLFSTKFIGLLMVLNFFISLLILAGSTFYFGFKGGVVGLMLSSFIALAVYYFSITLSFRLKL
jgi:O-antigen/teichoic acid export membrane protein